MKEWGTVYFLVIFGCIYGGLVSVFRERISNSFAHLKRMRFPVFLILAAAVSVAEEICVYSLGNRIAVPDIWRDIIIVPGEWSVWFAAWYLIIARKFRFTQGQALLAAGVSGILFEYIGTGLFLSNPVGLLLYAPLTIITYAAIFVLPLQAMDFTGMSESRWKYPVSIFLPYVLSIPAALILYAVFD